MVSPGVVAGDVLAGPGVVDTAVLDRVDPFDDAGAADRVALHDATTIAATANHGNVLPVFRTRRTLDHRPPDAQVLGKSSCGCNVDGAGE